MSVIVPCHNRARIVVETLDSVLQQTYRPIELIVVDDGSTDGSPKIVERWIGALSCDRAFSACTIRQENRGPSGARNAGLGASTGEYIQFLDSDDRLHPEKLATQVDAMARSEVGFCVCNYQTFHTTIDEPGETVDFYSRPHSPEEFPMRYPMDTPAPLYRRRAVRAAGTWNESLRAAEDFEFNFRLVCKGQTGVWLNRTLLFVRKGGDYARIQSTPLKERFPSMLQGLNEMEKTAADSGLLTRRMRRNLGLRALVYAVHMGREGAHEEAAALVRRARERMPAWAVALELFRRRTWRPLMKRLRSRTPRLV